MQEVDDDKRVSQLAIPGTHNSAACHTALPSVQCQDATIGEQLKHGVRFFDIRLSRNFLKGEDDPDQEDLIVIHGKFPVKLLGNVKLKEVLQDIYEFLDSHRSETVIVSLKQEGTGSWDNDHDEFGNCIWDRFINKDKDKWYLGTEIPRLRDARGKAILFRRFGVKDENRKREFGIEASWWNYNTTNDDRGDIQVQDWCEISLAEDIGKKAQYVKDHVKRSIEYNSTDSNTPKLFVNFCSGSNFFDHDCWPQKISEGLIEDDLQGAFGKGCGIVVLDYAEADDWKMAKALVDKNF